MKTIIAAALAITSISACVAVPTDPAELAAYRAENTARTASRAKATGSVLPGSKAETVEMSARNIDAIKQELPTTQVSDIWE